MDTPTAYPTDLVKSSREKLSALKTQQVELFKQGEYVQKLIFAAADAVDEVLLNFWNYYLNQEQQDSGLCLIATGGYGRRELHPGSDVDVMVLLPDEYDSNLEQSISEFLTILWDIGLEVGHSVRTTSETVTVSTGDISIATCLQESRLLSGKPEVFEHLLEVTGPKHIWPSDQFFEAKFEEQQIRHQRYRGTAFNLEPNIKGNIGGMRDLQVIAWVLKRHFDVTSFTELVEKGFLTRDEHIQLNKARDFLWRIRFALHTIAKRREDRLLFDHQIKVAELLGFQGNSNERPVEQFMRAYYRMAMTLSRLNEMLLQMFREVILEKDEKDVVHILDDDLQSTNNYLDIRNDQAFTRSPDLILRLFIVWKDNPSLRGITARTTRRLIENLVRIDYDYQTNRLHQRHFLKLFEKPERIFNTLLRMNRYGVLGAFLPAFGRVVGHMQFDLFHAFTVDTHTLFVIKELEKLCIDEHDNQQVKTAINEIDDLQVLLLSGLFHDIAKGRGGDHSTLGATEAEHFSDQFGLNSQQKQLLSWLVEQHLVLSVTAQKKDIDDPAVIEDFAQKIPDPKYLHYLYILTIADVRGTNPKLWNEWKASLFARLYQGTLNHFSSDTYDQSNLVAENKRLAWQELQKNYSEEQVTEMWNVIDEEYFLRHKADEIIWHTECALGTDKQQVIAIREHQTKLIDFTTRNQNLEIFIGGLYSPELFSHVAVALTDLNLNIFSAKLFRNKELMNKQIVSAITFRVSEERTDINFDYDRIQQIQNRLQAVLDGESIGKLQLTATKQMKLFKTPTNITFSEDPSGTYTTMDVSTADRPGLLAMISSCIAELEVDINLAKIMTIGERAEDVFYLSDANKNKLNTEQQEALGSKIKALLSPNSK